MGLNEETKYEITNCYYCFVNSLIRFIRLDAICGYRSLNERAVTRRKSRCATHRTEQRGAARRIYIKRDECKKTVVN